MSVEDQIVDFYYSLFETIFTEPFRNKIPERLKRDAVKRQIEDAAGAASQSLTRFLLNEGLTSEEAASLLKGLGPLYDLLKLEDIANPNIPPEIVVDELLPKLPCPSDVRNAGRQAVYRLALYSIVQALKLVGPVMAEWEKLNFSGSYEPSRRIINKLNQISEQLEALRTAGQAARDETYELTYRDYLLQRFHLIEAGTVRMTTSQDVSLAELFVMPRVLARPSGGKAGPAEGSAKLDFMNLATARQQFMEAGGHETKKNEKGGNIALDQVRREPRNVIVGAPGGGKTTFLEWLQLKIAGAEEELVMAGQQAIPLLLRVRQLNPGELPRGAALIEKAIASKDLTLLMPQGWIERQMTEGRVFFMLDGLDELDPELRDSRLLPWFLEICGDYPHCRYLVSSRPEGYPVGTLCKQQFIECDLLDFDEPQVAEYARHWCIAVRLARNEAETEARREGLKEGESIVAGFYGHPYTRNLARNPLMLSAICLVNYFEGGQLPRDRAVLYRLCVEGLLHNWDQRRGISSEFGFNEKLRACREVAVKMEADDRAEYEAPRVQAIFTTVLGDSTRAQRLLEHIRRRTGLLLERRPGVFAFAHLTFQEYLSARAVHEGNRAGIDVKRLVNEHNDGRWNEVIALYCGLAPAPAARELIENLMACQNSESLPWVLAEAYLSAGELSQDASLRGRVMERIAVSPMTWAGILDRFPVVEVKHVTNLLVGLRPHGVGLSGAHAWLRDNPQFLDEAVLLERVRGWRRMHSMPLSELVHLLHWHGSDQSLMELAGIPELYSAPGPAFYREQPHIYQSQAEIALIGLSQRPLGGAPTQAWKLALLHILQVFSEAETGITPESLFPLTNVLKRIITLSPPSDPGLRREYMNLARELARKMELRKLEQFVVAVDLFNKWADSLEPGRPMNEKEAEGDK
jgi:hypothetical protein